MKVSVAYSTVFLFNSFCSQGLGGFTHSLRFLLYVQYWKDAGIRTRDAVTAARCASPVVPTPPPPWKGLAEVLSELFQYETVAPDALAAATLGLRPPPTALNALGILFTSLPAAPAQLVPGSRVE